MKRTTTLRKLLLTFGIMLAVNAVKAQISQMSDFASGTQAAYCPSEDVKLTSAATGASTYVWKRYAGTNTSGTATPLSTTTATLVDHPSTPGYYTYVSTAVNSDNCTSTDSAPFTIYMLPGINATAAENAGGPTSYCTNSFPATAMTLTASVSSNPSVTETFAYVYQWYKGTNAISGATGATYTLTSTNDSAVGTFDYTVKVTYKVKPTCTETQSAPVSITVHDIPGTPTITITP